MLLQNAIIGNCTNKILCAHFWTLVLDPGYTLESSWQLLQTVILRLNSRPVKSEKCEVSSG